VTIFAIDPGPVKSALVVFDGERIISHEHSDNHQLLKHLRGVCAPRHAVLVVEKIASFGLPVGAEVFATAEWSGRFIEAWTGAIGQPWAQLKRHEIKQTLCHSQKAKDPHIRQALIDRFGPGKEIAIGKRSQPGPLFGITGDCWSALAVAIAWWERNNKSGATWNKQ
jgi:hypothetical protein